jgi:hypothetical protein
MADYTAVILEKLNIILAKLEKVEKIVDRWEYQRQTTPPQPPGPPVGD